MVKTYERRANEPLLRALEPGGFAHVLVEYAQSGMFGFDLQFRRGQSDHHATLYVGTTAALELHANSQSKYRLKTHQTWAQKKLGWTTHWAAWQTERQLSDTWEAVALFVERLTGVIARQGTHLQEEIVQAAVMRSPQNGFTMIDREVVISYTDNPEKQRALKATSGPWLAAAYREDAPQWWKSSQPTKPSTECDVLGLSRTGQLLAIEVKPASASATAIAWSPLQARQYATQIQSWVDDHGSVVAENLHDLMRQQQRICMRKGGALPRIDITKPVRPVVVVDRRASEQARLRMFQVMEHLRQTGLDPAVDIYLTDVIGRLAGPVEE